jgi:hypothetical protein
MKKTVLVICLVALFVALGGIMGTSFASGQAEDSSYRSAAQTSTELQFVVGSKNYSVGKAKKLLSVAPFTKDARTLIPIRYVVEAIGGTIDWVQETQETSITVGTTNIVMTVGESTASVNGVVKPIDSTNPKIMPMNVNGRVFIPLRFVLETINAEVVWNPYTKTVTIRYPKPEMVEFDDTKFSIKYPSNWTKESSDDGEMFISPEGNNVSVTFESLDSTMTVTEYYNESVKDMKASIKGLKVLDQSTATIAGGEGRKITYTMPYEDITLKITHVFTVSGKVGYFVTYGADTGMYFNYSDTFNSVLSTFAIK